MNIENRLISFFKKELGAKKGCFERAESEFAIGQWRR